MHIYFDNSIVSQVIRDGNEDALVKWMATAGHGAVVSDINFAEAYASGNEDNRKKRIGLLERLLEVPDSFALPTPGSLIDLLLRGLTMNDVIVNVAKRPAMTPEEVLKTHQEQQASFLAMHTAAKPEMQAALDNGLAEGEDPKQILRCRRSAAMYMRDQWQRSSPVDVLEGWCNKFNVSPPVDVRAFIEHNPPVLNYLAAWALSVHRCAIHANRGLRKSAGKLDIMQAFYLPFCNVFATRDKKQREILRVVTVLNNTARQKIWLLEHLYMSLDIKPATTR